MMRSIPKDLFENTTSGGICTIIVIIIAEMLAISELMWFYTTTYEETVGVGNSFNNKMDLYLDLTLDTIGCDQVAIQLWDKYQDKPVPIAGSSFHMTRVIDGSSDTATTRKTDLHHHDSHFLAHTMFEHAELERDWDAPDPNFNEHTFSEQIDVHDLTFIFFYVDWCPHCRATHPKWKKAVREIDDTSVKDGNGNDLKISMIQINCVPFETLCWEKDVSQYPAIRLYSRNESYIEYNGERQTKEFVQFIKETALKTHHEGTWVPDRQVEGCHLKGLLRIPRVPGHLQFSKRGRGHSIGWADLSHHVVSYTFLDPYDQISVGATGLQTNPIDGKKFTSSDRKTAFAHYATLVQTELVQRWYGTRMVYQLSVLSVENKLTDKRKLSIRFVHDMFPMAVKYSQESKPFGHFVIRLCAILGGLYTLFSLIHAGLTSKKKLY